MSTFLAEIGNHSIGIHVSISGKLDQSVDRALTAGCVGTFQIFTCSPRMWNAVSLKPEEVSLFREKVKENNLQVFVHMPYLPNLSSPDKTLYSKSVDVLKREIARCGEIGVRDLVLHCGSHLGTSIESGQSRIADACNEALRGSSKSTVRLLLENSAGVKNSVGSDFKHIHEIMDQIDEVHRVGVCFDTCHAFAAGYNLSSEDAVKKTFGEFERQIGKKKLFLIHLNDSKGDLGDGLDRHEHIGKGKIGRNGMLAILRLNDLAHIPIVLETPYEKDGDDKLDISRVKRLITS